LNYRSTKGHRVQESGKASKTNVSKLASSLQRFLKTGAIPSKELRAIDDQLTRQMRDELSEAIRLFTQLKGRLPKSVEVEEETRLATEEWNLWLSKLESSALSGFGSLGGEENAERRRRVVDIDSDLFNAMISFRNSLRSEVEKSSYEPPNWEEIRRNSKEIFALLSQRMASAAAK
jgi:hypothetical protein